MTIDKTEYEAGATAARQVLGLQAKPAADASTSRQRDIMEHPLALGRHKALAEHLASQSAMPASEAIAALTAAATPEERGAAAAIILGFGS